MTTRPPALQPSFPPDAPPTGCVDIGGTKVATCVAGAGGIRGRMTAATIKTGDPDALARQVLALLAASCSEAGIETAGLAAVGVSSCGPFVLQAGQIELAAPNICGGIAGPSSALPNEWASVPLEAPLRAALKNLRIENDCVAALEAERRWGALQGLDHCAYVTWSTGIGMGLCVDGRVLRGKHGNAGHGGHMFVSDNDDAVCGCGNVGDLEALVAGTAIARRFGARGYPDASALLTAASTGEPTAVALVDELCRLMGRALYNLVATLDLQAISLGGSVFWNHRSYLLPRLEAEVAGRFKALTSGCELLPAGLGDRVGDYAALALVS